MIQSCPEASPAKWHLAHTAWFFESFILSEFLPGYRLFDRNFPWLFNSYYQTFTAIPEKRLRASFSRPSLDEILSYRRHVDEALEELMSAASLEPEALRRVELGVNHEEQHQELLLTDILNALFTNPLRPAYIPFEAGADGASGAGHAAESEVEFEGGLQSIGAVGDGFCFDNELNRHRVWLEPYRLSSRLVTCGEFAAFMADGGYRKPELWLSAGWDATHAHGWRAPMYWSEPEGECKIFTLRGEQTFDELRDVPVSHVSYYEADAYARWVGRRLPTEAEWENAAADQPVAGNLLDSGNFHPTAADGQDQTRQAGGGHGLEQIFGDCWEWTGSAYLAYPGFKPLNGSLGEYNGKFMSGQMVLRGGSCVTPQPHIRASYRNFFAPETRWQFSGIRLAS